MFMRYQNFPLALSAILDQCKPKTISDLHKLIYLGEEKESKAEGERERVCVCVVGWVCG